MSENFLLTLLVILLRLYRAEVGKGQLERTRRKSHGGYGQSSYLEKNYKTVLSLKGTVEKMERWQWE